MPVRVRTMTALAVCLIASTVLPTVSAQATAPSSVRSSVNHTMTTTMPIVRLHFTVAVSAKDMAPLSIHPPVATVWQQIGPRDLQAVVTGSLHAFVNYVIKVPTTVQCATKCTATTSRSFVASVPTSVTWEEQLLARLKYLPVSFTPSSATTDPAQQTSGTFVWLFPKLASFLGSQWRQGSDNVLLTGAMMAFQNNHSLPTTGVADEATWAALQTAVRVQQVNPNPYSFVDVSEAQPQTVTLYVAGTARFHTLANTGISVSPTQSGIHPVYLRYATQTMSGTNPDGSHYSDPGIPWVSYFYGGDALHGFIRSTYGWPQSLGCVEMPFAAAKVLWPYTPIGTLVSVH